MKKSNLALSVSLFALCIHSSVDASRQVISEDEQKYLVRKLKPMVDEYREKQLVDAQQKIVSLNGSTVTDINLATIENNKTKIKNHLSDTQFNKLLKKAKARDILNGSDWTDEINKTKSIRINEEKNEISRKKDDDEGQSRSKLLLKDNINISNPKSIHILDNEVSLNKTKHNRRKSVQEDPHVSIKDKVDEIDKTKSKNNYIDISKKELNKSKKSIHINEKGSEIFSKQNNDEIQSRSKLPIKDDTIRIKQKETYILDNEASLNKTKHNRRKSVQEDIHVSIKDDFLGTKNSKNDFFLSPISSKLEDGRLYLKDQVFPYLEVRSFPTSLVSKLVPLQEIVLEDCQLPIHKAGFLNLKSSGKGIKWEAFSVFENLEKFTVNRIQRNAITHDHQNQQVDIHVDGNFNKLLGSLSKSLKELSLINLNLTDDELVKIFSQDNKLSNLTNLRKINLYGNDIQGTPTLFETFLTKSPSSTSHNNPLIINFYGDIKKITSGEDILQQFINLKKAQKSLNGRNTDNIKFVLTSNNAFQKAFNDMGDFSKQYTK